MRVSLIGPGNVEYHFKELLRMSEDRLIKHIESIADVLIKSKVELVLLPDYGLSLDIAKKVKENGDNKIIATIPLDDKELGYERLKQFIDLKVGGKNLFDAQINTGDWYKQDMTKCLFGDVILFLGFSLGSMGELVYAFYLYKILGKYVNKINSEIVAGQTIPFTVLIYKPFVKGKLNFEIEEYINKAGGQIYYIRNAKELKEKLQESDNRNIYKSL